jgi:hypothetical protein
MKAGKIFLLAVFFGSVPLFGRIAKADYNLRFRHSIEPNGGGYVAPDTFYAKGSNEPGVSVGYGLYDVIQPPPPPSGNYVQAYTVVDSHDLTIDAQPYDPNLPDNLWLIKLKAFDGLTGTAHFDLKDPNDLNNLPPYTLAIVQRQTSGGTPIQNYNLAETPNISWSVNSVQGIHSQMELKVIDECLRVSRLAADPNFVDFKDFAVLANGWNQTGPLAGDINGNNTTDFNDLSILAAYWLCDCYQQ